MKKRRTDTFAVSEVLGTILLLGISVSLFSVIYISFFAVDVEPSTPNVDMMATLQDNHLIVEHRGGEDLDLETRLMIRYNETSPKSSYINASDFDYINESDKDDNKWNIGEKLEFDLSNLPDYKQFESIDITVVDAESNSAILMGKLKEIPVADVAIKADGSAASQDDISISCRVKNYGPNTAKNVLVRMDVITDTYAADPNFVENYNNTTPGTSFSFNRYRGYWSIPSLDVESIAELEFNGKLKNAPSVSPLNQLVILLDGSDEIDGIPGSEWDQILQGIANSIKDPSIISHMGNVELTVIQFGDLPLAEQQPHFLDARIEIERELITSANYNNIANQVLSISKIGGSICPLDDAFTMVPYAIAPIGGNYNPGNNQMINVITDAYPFFIQQYPHDPYPLAIEIDDPYEPYPDIYPGHPSYFDVLLARNDMISQLGMTDSGEDQINFIMPDNPSNVPLSILRNLIFPSPLPDEDITQWAPDGPGWVKVVESDISGGIAEAFDFQIKDGYTKIKVDAWIEYTEYEDPNLENNKLLRPIGIPVPIR